MATLMSYYNHNNWDKVPLGDLLSYYTYALNEQYRAVVMQANIWGAGLNTNDKYFQNG